MGEQMVRGLRIKLRHDYGFHLVPIGYACIWLLVQQLNVELVLPKARLCLLQYLRGTVR